MVGGEVPLPSGFAFTMLSLVAIWQAMHQVKWKISWLLLASLTYGLAIASRPNLLFGAVILFIPLIYEWRSAGQPAAGRKIGPLVFAITCPIAVIGAGLMLYNYLRFENALDFGWNYQLGASGNGHRVRQFSPYFFCYNFYYYFLEPMRWTAHFPFLQTFDPPIAPLGHEPAGKDCGGILLVNYPLALSAFAAALVWRRKGNSVGAPLRLFVVIVSIVFVSSCLLLCLFTNTWNRFELDFLPALMILSVIGVFNLEQELTGVGRRIVRIAWCLLVADTLAFNTLASVEGYATGYAHNGNFLVNDGKPVEALPYLQRALALEPGSANFHTGLGTVYFRQRRLDDAIVEFKRAFEIESNFPEAATAHNNLGYCLLEEGRVDDAIVQFKITLGLKPGFAETHNTLGDCFFQTGRTNEAIKEYENAVKLNPDYAEAQNNLGYGLFLLGRTKEAAIHFQLASEAAPNNADFHNNAGSCLLQTGQLDDAIAQLRMAIQLQPHFAQAYHNLAETFRRKGMQAQAKANDQKAAEFSAEAGTDKRLRP
jgi:tetratricopeptide (TPR) repeat protein